jgi:hypothetical protein
VQRVSAVATPLGLGALICRDQHGKCRGLQGPERGRSGVGMGEVEIVAGRPVCDEKVLRNLSTVSTGGCG